MNLNETKRNNSIILITILIASFFNSFMSAAINIALPKISIEFSMSAIALSWVSMSFLLASAIFLIPLGKFADIVGRKKIFLWGSVLFFVSNIICTILNSSLGFISMRFVQGIGSAMIFSTSMAIIVSTYPPQNRGKMIGLVVSAVYLGLTLAPALGGLLTQLLGWRSIFYISTAAGIIPILVFSIIIKTEWKDNSGNAFDTKGTLLYMPAIMCIMLGFSKLPEWYAFTLLAVGILILIWFVKYESKTDDPIVPVRLFIENKVFLFSNLISLINYSATFAITFLLSLYLQYAKELSPRDAGIILITQPAMMVLIASFAGKLSDKYNARNLSTIGISLIVVGLCMMIFIEYYTSIHYIIFSLLLIGIGFGFFSSPNTNIVMSSVTKQQLGMASAMTGTMRILGQMTSMAITTMVLHVLIGKQQISTENIDLFIVSCKIVFSISTVLCLVGIIISFIKN